MDKLRLIRENEEQFKKHLEEIENLEIQQKEQNMDNMILQSNEEQKAEQSRKIFNGTKTKGFGSKFSSC